MQIHNPQLTQLLTPPTAKPQSILKQIVWHKQQEVVQMQNQQPLVDLQTQISAVSSPRDFLLTLRHSHSKPSLIAEVKKHHPVKELSELNLTQLKLHKPTNEVEQLVSQY